MRKRKCNEESLKILDELLKEYGIELTDNPEESDCILRLIDDDGNPIEFDLNSEEDSNRLRDLIIDPPPIGWNEQNGKT